MLKQHPVSGYLVNEDGTEIYNPKTGYKLRPTLSPAGYFKIGNYICSSGMVHQLVFEAWGSLVPKGLCINHKDGNKTNNRVDNLEVVTVKENTVHAYALGLATGKKGSDNSMSKLSTNDVLTIYEMFNAGRCNDCISRVFNIHSRYVSLIRSGKRWSFIYKGPFEKSNKYRCVCCSATTIETAR
jgi:hypothetical protein